MKSNEDIVREVQADHNRRENLSLLYEQNKGLISGIAIEMARISGVEKEDLEQEGYFGIVKAADRWQENAGCSFISYAALWVKSVMLQYAHVNSQTIRIPAFQRSRVRQYRLAENNYIMEHGHKPPTKELAMIMGLSPDQVEAAKDINTSFMLMHSLDASVPGAEDLTGVDLIEDTTDYIGEADERIRQEQLAKALWSAVGELPEDQGRVLEMRYKEERTLASCAEEIGKSKARVQQLEKAAIKELRRPSDRSRLLRSFLDETVDAMSYHGTGLCAFRHTHTSAPERMAIRLIDGPDKES